MDSGEGIIIGGVSRGVVWNGGKVHPLSKSKFRFDVKPLVGEAVTIGSSELEIEPVVVSLAPRSRKLTLPVVSEDGSGDVLIAHCHACSRAVGSAVLRFNDCQVPVDGG